MTIKGKLTFNVLLVFLIVTTVVVTGITAMIFVKNRLSYLTERSTPFQVRTVELQRALQENSADLVKVASSRNMNEYQGLKTDAEKSLAGVREAEERLRALAHGAGGNDHDIEKIAGEIIRVTAERLKAEEEGAAAHTMIGKKLTDATAKLSQLNGMIRGLQNSRARAYEKSVDDTKAIAAKVRSIEALRGLMKDLQLAIFEVQRAQGKSPLIIARGKANSIISKALQNSYLKGSPGLSNDVKILGTKIEEMVAAHMTNLNQQSQEYAALDKDVGERLSSITLAIEQEVVIAGERYNAETQQQEDIFSHSSVANAVIVSNSELMALGLAIEGLASKLFTVSSRAEVASVERDMRKAFAQMDPAIKSMNKSLTSLNAKKELAILRESHSALESVKSLMFMNDGILEKVNHQLLMREKSQEATESLRKAVLKQAEIGRQSVSEARTEQEKAIGAVNRIVALGTSFIIFIGIAAVFSGILFGIWVYRSIAKPLQQLITVSDKVASGQLNSTLGAETDDEVGKVQSSMARMVANLRDMAGKIKGVTQNLAGNSEEMAMTSTSLQRGAEEQSSMVELSSTAMAEMSQTNVEVARTTMETSENARKMKEIAEQGKEFMQTTARELMTFAETVREAAGNVESLGQQSEEITEIVTLIRDIADQTNLLALNAAIEAARAGEQGRGFAVVADNVRDLAKKTATATEEIAKTVKAMQEKVAESISYMHEERGSLDRVVGNVNQTLVAMEEIVRHVEQVTEMVQKIAVAAEQQSATSDDVSRNMENISTVTRKLMGSFANIKRSSDNLSQLATELNGMVGWFKM